MIRARLSLGAQEIWGVMMQFLAWSSGLSRHDYFRRVLCNWLGEKVASGELADNEDQLACIAKKICYQNAADYLGIS